MSTREQLWSVCRMSTLDDYLQRHLRVQGLLFADVLENFRDVMLKDFSLDVLHYFSLLGFCWDACHYQSQVTLELLTCEEMHGVILNRIRVNQSIKRSIKQSANQLNKQATKQASNKSVKASY